MTKNKSCVCGLFAASVFMGIIQILLYPFLYNQGMGNIKYYVGACICFFVVFIGASFLSHKMGWGDYVKEPFVGWGIFLLVLGWFFAMYFLEPQQEYFMPMYSLRHSVPVWLYFIALFGTIGLIGLLTWKVRQESKVLKLSVAAVMASFQAACLWVPNIIADKSGTLFHLHAYFNPIYNAVDFMPYSSIIKSLYGHYSLFYILPVRFLMLFGITKVHAVILFTVFIGFVSFLLLYYLLAKIIKGNVLYIASVLAVSYLSFNMYLTGQYYQILPHRILFPILTLWVSYLVLNGKCRRLVLWIVSGLALLWNLESGMVCLVVCCVAAAADLRQDEIKNGIKLRLKNYLLIPLWAVSSLLGGYLFLNLYNLIIRGTFIPVMDYIFPIASNDYVIGDIELKLPGITGLYFAEILIFLCAAVFTGIKILSKEAEIKKKLVLLSAVMGLGMLTYYINRAAFGNISISHIYFVIVISGLLQILLEDESKVEEVFGRSFWQAAMASLFIFMGFYVLGSVANVKDAVTIRANSVWNTDTLNAVCDEFREKVPENTVAVGIGLPDLYSVLKWDGAVAIMEYANLDVCPNLQAYVKEQIKDEKLVLFQKDSYNVLYEPEDWILLADIGSAFQLRAFYNHDIYDYAQGLCQYSLENDMTDSQYIDLLCLNFLGGIPEEDLKKGFLDYLSLRDREEGRLELTYYFMENAGEE